MHTSYQHRHPPRLILYSCIDVGVGLAISPTRFLGRLKSAADSGAVCKINLQCESEESRALLGDSSLLLTCDSSRFSELKRFVAFSLALHLVMANAPDLVQQSLVSKQDPMGMQIAGKGAALVETLVD